MELPTYWRHDSNIIWIRSLLIWYGIGNKITELVMNEVISFAIFIVFVCSNRRYRLIFVVSFPTGVAEKGNLSFWFLLPSCGNTSKTPYFDMLWPTSTRLSHTRSHDQWHLYHMSTVGSKITQETQMPRRSKLKFLSHFGGRV